MIDFSEPFRRLPRWAQWIVGPALLAESVRELLREPQAGEPHQAFFVTLLFFIGTVILSEWLRSKPKVEDQRPAGLGDFQLPTATEGRVVPLIWGRVKLTAPNVVWYGDLQQDAITEKVKTGLWSSTRVTKGFQYHIGIQFAWCRGPITSVRQVWIGDVGVFFGNATFSGGIATVDIDEPELFGGNDLGTGGVQATLEFFEGSATQPVSAYLDNVDRQRITSAATPTAPRYTGTTHAVWRELGAAAATARGGYVGNSTQIRTVACEVERYPALFAGQSAGENKVVIDANPINVLYEILTNDEWGLGFLPADIDLASFLLAADTCITEGNGFSMVLDRALQAVDLIAEIERQVDGVVFLDHRTGLWRIKLARADYTIGSVPQVNETNSTFANFTRGAWEDTTNQIQVRYNKRDDDYKESFALAQDSANILIQGAGSVLTGKIVSSQANYPGVKSSTLAVNIAWRDLRTQSYPLSRATFDVDRSFWDMSIGDVFAWSDANLGIVQLPMRVTHIDFGRLQENKITVEAVQDVFHFAVASYGTPPATGWTPPTVDLVAFPSDEQVALEAPRGILVRDPDYAGDDTIAKVLSSARRQGAELSYEISQRNASGTPSGSYAFAGDVVAFARIGELQSALGAGVASPTSTITVVPTPDSQSQIESVFDDAATLQDLGVDLVQLVMVDDEFMLVRSASNSGGNVNLENIYRGVLDSVQANHSAGASVWLLFVGAGLTDTTFPATNNVDVQLRMRSASEVFAGSVTTIALTMAKRAIRPYAPNAPLYNGTATAFGVPDVEGDGSGLNGLGFDVNWRRRRYTTGDEVAELLADFAPDASTEYQVRVFVDPDGVNTEITGSPFGWATGTGPVFINRLRLWDVAAAGTEIRIKIEARHDVGAEVDLRGRYDMIHDVVPTSARDGNFYLGGNLGPSTATNAFIVASVGVHTIRIGAAYSTSNIEIQVNGGGWSTVITAGGTSGATVSLSVSDQVELRHTVSETPDPQFVAIDNPSATRVAYGTFSA